LNDVINTTFDPFNDRIARDIRNSLSSALVSDLFADKGEKIDQVVLNWGQQRLLPLYQDYIRQTRERYRQVEVDIKSARIEDPRFQALVLWNAGLFFELHELLETIWHGTQGIERTGLKGLIQAAGVYVHRQRENIDAASGLAQRARQNLLAGKDHLNFIANLAQLIECLADPSQPPPHLVSLKR
jgi:hypothetical protein